MKTLLIGLVLVSTSLIQTVNASCLEGYNSKINRLEWDLHNGASSWLEIVGPAVSVDASLIASGVYPAPVALLSASGSISYRVMNTKKYEKVSSIIQQSYSQTMYSETEEFIEDVKDKADRPELYDSEILERVVEMDKEQKFCVTDLQDYDEVVLNVARTFKK